MQPEKEFIKLTIDRSKWGKSQLYDSNTGNMCALGFLGKKLGVSEREMLNRGYPAPTSHWKNTKVFECRGGVKISSAEGIDVYTVNDKVKTAIDKGTMAPSKGEALLRRAMKKLNVELTFTGEYAAKNKADH